MIRPVLELVDRQDITRHIARDAMMDRFKLTPEEREPRIKSGTLTIGNRAGWAMTHLTKGTLIEKAAKATYRITDKERKLLAEYEGPLTIPIMLEIVPGFQEAWEAAKKKKAEKLAQKVILINGDRLAERKRRKDGPSLFLATWVRESPRASRGFAEALGAGYC